MPGAYPRAGDAWPDVDVVEHIERTVSPGIFARTAVDRRSLDRQDGERVLRASLSVPHQVRQIQDSAVATTGDHVFVVCVPADRMDRVTGQFTPRDSVQVCVASPRGLLWWTTLSGVEAAESRDGAESLADLGLGPGARVADLVRSQPTAADAPRSSRASPELRGGRRLVAA